MKQIVLLFVLAVFFMGCASTQYRNGRDSVKVASLDTLRVYPMEAEIVVGEKISGVAECETWFGLFSKFPSKQTFGAEIQNNAGNFAPDECTRGAIYDALVKGKADTIVAPQYTAVKKKDSCLFGVFCFHVVDQIIVTGYKGTIKEIRPIDKELVDFKWKADALKAR